MGVPAFILFLLFLVALFYYLLGAAFALRPLCVARDLVIGAAMTTPGGAGTTPRPGV